MPGKVIQIEQLTGLKTADIPVIQQRFGKNIFSLEKPRSFLRLVLDIVREPMFMLLIVACALALRIGAIGPDQEMMWLTCWAWTRLSG
jgi:Ca2+-transporting ATPase